MTYRQPAITLASGRVIHDVPARRRVSPGIIVAVLATALTLTPGLLVIGIWIGGRL